MLKRKNVPYENIESLIASGMTIKGDLSSQGSVRIDGNVEGTLMITGDLVLGEKGSIKGEVKASNIILAGKMNGNVSASDRLEITATGNICGDASCRVITVAEGGVLEGKTCMSTQTKPDGVHQTAKR